MIPQPSIVAADDNEQHLGAIVRCFQQMGSACLPLLYTNGALQVPRELTAVRLLFFDLNYVPGTPTGPMLYDIAGGVLEKVIRPGNGPYVLITWSSHETEHQNFLRHVHDNFDNIPPPAASSFMDKAPFIAGGAPDAVISDDQLEGLACRIRQLVDRIPQVSALLHWEDAARAAAGDVIASLIDLVPREACFIGSSGDHLEDLLLTVARAAVGTKNVEADRVYAINEGLGPILLDHLTHTTESRRKETQETWGNALSNMKKSVPPDPKQLASLNAQTLISSRDLAGVVPGDRGAVSTLSDHLDADVFKTFFGAEKRELIGEYIEIKNADLKNQELMEKHLSTCSWRLVGIRASCDQAQQRGIALKRVCLTVEAPSTVKSRSHGAYQESPLFTRKNEVVKLIFNWHYTTALTDAHLNGSQVVYRLREPLISHITTTLHVHGLRPGIISYP